MIKSYLTKEIKLVLLTLKRFVLFDTNFFIYGKHYPNHPDLD